MTYILIFVGFLIVLFLLQKLNHTQLYQILEKNHKNNPLQDLSSHLGLQFEELKGPEQKNPLYSIGGRAYGEYNGIPIEIRFQSNTEIGNGIGMVYRYTLDRTVTFDVKNPGKKSFDILPKRDGLLGGTTQNSRFDEKLLLVGDAIIPNNILNYFASLGWMHLTLKENKLTFHDTFYEQFQGISARKNIMKTRHPIWKNTPQDTAINEASARAFFDTLTEFCKRSNLV